MLLLPDRALAPIFVGPPGLAWQRGPGQRTLAGARRRLGHAVILRCDLRGRAIQ